MRIKAIRGINKRSLPKGTASVTIAAILWGLSFPFIKWGLQFIDFLSFLFLRFFVAALFSICLLFLLYRRQVILKLKALRNPKILLLGVFVTLGFLFQFWGQTLTTAGKASLYINSNVIFVALVSHLIGDERLTRKTILSVCLGVIGIYFLTVGGNPNLLLQGELLGDILSFISGLFWALYIIVSKKILALNADTSSSYLSSLDLSLILIILSLIYLFFINVAIILVTPANTVISFTLVVPVNAWIAVIFLALFSTTLAYYLYFYGLERISAVKSSVFLLIEIITAVVIGILFLNEILTLPILIGSLLIGLAILLIG